MAYVAASVTTSVDTSILLMGRGYKDWYMKTSGSLTTTVPTFGTYSSGDSYYYDTATASVGTAITTHGPFNQQVNTSYDSQRGQELYDANFETVNFYFDTESIQSDVIHTFINTVVSHTGLQVSFATDSNYIFTTPTDDDVYRQGDVEETADFDNTTIYYKGTKQVIVQELFLESRIGNAVKYKVSAIMETATGGESLDDIKINSMTILPNELLMVGGENA